MGLILVEYEPKPSHTDLIRTKFPDFVQNLAVLDWAGVGDHPEELRVLSEFGHFASGVGDQSSGRCQN